MILVGNQRGGAKDLANHLLKDENDHVDIHELRGFVSDNLHGAFQEAYAISRATRCKQFLFSLSLNPPIGADISTKDFEAAIAQVENKLGLTNQPRAIVFHEKEGRRHCHAVWSRIDAAEMKAVQLSHSKRKMNAVSRSLFLEHGWEMPDGFKKDGRPDPKNFTLEEWQQAKRIGKDPREIAHAIQTSWQASDSAKAFAAALKERGYWLARGDRRGFVAVDRFGEVYSIARKAKVKTREVKAKLGDSGDLPSVAERQQEIAAAYSSRLEQIHTRQERIQELFQQKNRQERLALVQKQREMRKHLRAQQEQRTLAEMKVRQDRYNKGLRGLLDRFTGKHKRIKAQNEAETAAALQRDRRERDQMIFAHVAERRVLKNKAAEMLRQYEKKQETVAGDLTRYRDLHAEAMKSQHSELRKQPKRHRQAQGPSLER